jgi:peptide/nickel transport system permease protein
MREFLVGLWPLIKSVGQNRLALFGAAVVFLVAVVAIFAPFIATHDPLAQDPYNKLQPPSIEHLMGTDDLGRDVFSRVVYGSRTTVAVAITSVALATVVGIPLGLVAGYSGRWINAGIMRVMDTLLAFPTLILALAIASSLGPGFKSSVTAIAVLGLPIFARLVCASTLSVKETEYVLAAKSIGCSGFRILGFHIFPNVTSPIIVQGTLFIGYAILLEAALSFIGLGIPPPSPTWGQMLRASYPYLQDQPWLPLASGIPVFLVVLAINFLGDGLRDALDPKLKSVRHVV